MIPGLYDDERRSLARWATMLILGGLAVLPVTTQSSSIAGASVVSAPTNDSGIELPSRLTFPGFSVRRDPFVPSHVGREKLESAAIAPQPDAPAAVPIVRAVVLGNPARALVEEEGVVRVFAVGDRIGALAIAAITPSGITLSDGAHLLLAPQRQ